MKHLAKFKSSVLFWNQHHTHRKSARDLGPEEWSVDRLCHVPWEFVMNVEFQVPPQTDQIIICNSARLRGFLHTWSYQKHYIKALCWDWGYQKGITWALGLVSTDQVVSNIHKRSVLQGAYASWPMGDADSQRYRSLKGSKGHSRLMQWVVS